MVQIYLASRAKRNNYGTRLGLLAQLVVRYTDGHTQVIGTDGQWKSRTGLILTSDIHDVAGRCATGKVRLE
jgi:hypothetical protein